MLKSRRWTLLFVVAAVLMLPSLAAAQSAIAGAVTDMTGAVLPGVTVEAASPALIEGVRSGITDEQGKYSIANLRPGDYTVTFTLPGFGTVKREGLELPSNFTATVNAQLGVGSLEETINVSGASPTVDVHDGARSQVLNRDLLDNIPTSRTTFGTGAIIPGVKLNTPDVGGSRAMQNVTMSVHGLGGGNNAIQVDGMLVNSQQSDGSVQGYHNAAMAQEMAYQTSTLNAELSGGGVRLNMIPRQGGNTFEGLAFIGGTPGSWVSQSVPDDLAAQGLKSVSSIAKIYDVNIAEGGPILRNKLWFFASFRRNAVDETIANAFYRDGSPAIQDQWITNPSLRLTWQATQRDKLTAYYDRALKQKGHELSLSQNPSGVDIETASTQRPWRNGLYYIGQVKWTSVQTSRVMLEAGLSNTYEYHGIICQDGISKPRGTAEWFASAPRVDLVLGTERVACTNGDRLENPNRHFATGQMSYVTGSHSFKTGLQWSWGPDEQSRTANADLIQQYRNGVPDSVVVANTPVADREYVNADIGTFVQDGWTIKRLTLNVGVRFEHFNSEIRAANLPAGRFVPARNFPEVTDVPNWNDVAPRFSAAWDVFGNGKTAVKGGINKYMTQFTGGFARRYTAVNYTASDTRNWSDLNHDDIAQDNEIGPSNNAKFGLAADRQPADDLRRSYNVEYSTSVQHELIAQTAVTFSFYRRNFRRVEAQDNLLISLNDYAAFQVPNPLGNGETITIYNLNKSKQGLADTVDRNSDINTTQYTGFEVAFQTRVKNFNAFGGWSAERTLTNTCDQTFNPNLLRFCDQFGNMYQELGTSPEIPLQHEFKFAGSYTLPARIRVSATLLSYAGTPLNVNWTVPAEVFPGGRTQSVSVLLIPPQTKFADRWNQLDLGFRKPLKFGRVEAPLQLDIFNVTDARTVLTVNQAFGPALGAPQSTLVGRMFRLSTNLKF